MHASRQCSKGTAFKVQPGFSRSSFSLRVRSATSVICCTSAALNSSELRAPTLSLVLGQYGALCVRLVFGVFFSVRQFFWVDPRSKELDEKNGFDTERLRRSKSTVFVLNGSH